MPAKGMRSTYCAGYSGECGRRWCLESRDPEAATFVEDGLPVWGGSARLPTHSLSDVVAVRTRTEAARDALPEVILVACVAVVLVGWLVTLVFFGFRFL